MYRAGSLKRKKLQKLVFDDPASKMIFRRTAPSWSEVLYDDPYLLTDLAFHNFKFLYNIIDFSKNYT